MTEQSVSPLHVAVSGEVGLIGLDAPPVNALGNALRQALARAVADLNAAPAARVIVIYGLGRGFSAGADIREFGKPRLDPVLPDLLNRIEASEKPVVALIHGVALGGGLELALACHARVALPGARLGLPEVALGLMPGAGGTQRLPRLTETKAAIDLITSGRELSAEAAMALGIVDRIGEGTPPEAALLAGRTVLDGALVPRRTGEISRAPDPGALAEATARLGAKRPCLAAPLKVVEAIALSGGPLAEGMAAERAMFLELMDGPDRRGMVHAFEAERAARRFPEAEATPRAITSAGVIGGGTMGVGIATALLNAELPVVLVETAAERAAAARVGIAANLDGAVKRGKMDAATRDARLGMLRCETVLEALAEADLVVEAVFEDMAVKTEIFGKLDALCKPGAVLATNTSYLDVNAIAGVTRRPEDVIGLHFFSPAHVMRLLEVVVADATAPEVVASALALAGRMKKVAVRAGVCDGFIGNRLMAHYRKAAEYMLLDGASFARIDAALEAFGFAMGPFAVADLAGLDIGWAARKRRAPTRPPEERYVEIADRICEQGWFGRKTGRGFYDYAENGKRVPNPEAEAIVAAERARLGITPRTFSDDEITARYMTAMVAEAARLLEEGIARRPSDIDAVLLFGYGFPRHLGGPLHYADRIGAPDLVARIEAYAEEDPHYWAMPTVLRDLAETGRSFADLNKE